MSNVGLYYRSKTQNIVAYVPVIILFIWYSCVYVYHCMYNPKVVFLFALIAICFAEHITRLVCYQVIPRIMHACLVAQDAAVVSSHHLDLTSSLANIIRWFVLRWLIVCLFTAVEIKHHRLRLLIIIIIFIASPNIP